MTGRGGIQVSGGGGGMFYSAVICLSGSFAVAAETAENIPAAPACEPRGESQAMRHLLMGHAAHGGMIGFMAMRLVRRMVTKLVLIGLVGLVIVLWLRSRRPGGF